MEIKTTNDLLNEIKSGLSQKNASHKDEVAVMQSMLSDPTYEVATYGKDGPTGTYNPCKDFRGMCASIISTATKIPGAEAEGLMENYTLKKGEADSMVNVSKEFLNTYLQTGRKIPMGGRATSDISLMAKHVEETTRECPRVKTVGGKTTVERVPVTIAAHDSVRVHAPCPTWVKK